MKSAKRNVAKVVFAALVGVIVSQSSACADPFPGKGDEQTWLQACQICNQGAQLLQINQFAESMKYFQKAIEMYPFDPVYAYDLGLAHQSYAYVVGTPLQKQSELKQAVSSFTQSLKLKPDKFDTWIHMANVQAELQEYENSLKSLQTALLIPGLSDLDKARTQQAMAMMRSHLGVTSAAQGSVQTPSAGGQSSTSMVGQAGGAVQSVRWISYGNASAPFTLCYPEGWQVSEDSKTGGVSVVRPDGAKLFVMPFSTATIVDAAKAPELMNGLLKALSPDDAWSKAEPLGTGTYRSTAVNASQSVAAALVLQANQSGTFGKLCVARVPKHAPNVDAGTFAEMLGSLRFNSVAASQQSGAPQMVAQQASAQRMAPQQAAMQQAATQQSAMGQQGASRQQLTAQQQMVIMQQPQMWQNMGQSGLPPTPFAGYTRFVDPTEHAFSVEVPVGWKAEGGLTRGSAIDTRPWVKVVSPDNLITAFIGDGSIPPFSMPTALGTQLGFGVGRAYGGGIVKSYVPAKKFVQTYANDKLKRVISDIQVVEQTDHPDLARSVNGTVGATRSECSSIKITGRYKEIPAVGYFLAATKATVGYGAGMWWVTYIAGEIGPADRDAGGLSVILHMIQTFQMDPQWTGQSLKTTGEVSRQYTQSSQQMSKMISDRYWSQQSFNDRMNQSYWNRQAVQDKAADNFSNYIRGVQNVQDPQSGNQYQVQYGPQYHWIDPGGNVMGTNYSAPGPEWRQLMAVP